MKAKSLPQADDGSTSSSREFVRIASAATALGFGAAAASLSALQRGPGGFAFQFSLYTPLAFLAGCALGWYFWKLATRGLLTSFRGILLWGAMSAGAFLYPLRFASSEGIIEVVQGLFLAFLAITGVAITLLRIRKYLEADSRMAEPARTEDESVSGKSPGSTTQT